MHPKLQIDFSISLGEIQISGPVEPATVIIHHKRENYH